MRQVMLFRLRLLMPLLQLLLFVAVIKFLLRVIIHVMIVVFASFHDSLPSRPVHNEVPGLHVLLIQIYHFNLVHL